jgi:hypothetical protein
VLRKKRKAENARIQKEGEVRERKRLADFREQQIQRDKKVVEEEKQALERDAKEKSERKAIKIMKRRILPRCSRIGAKSGASYSSIKEACERLAIEAVKKGYGANKITDNMIKNTIQGNPPNQQ